MSSKKSEDDDESKLYYGERGDAWRTFQRDIMARGRGKFSKGDRYSFKQAFLKMDEGGTAVGAPAMPGAAAALAAAQQKQAVRRGEAFTWLFDQIGNQKLKDMLEAIDEAHADGLAGAAWDLLVAECSDPGDELELSRLDAEWQNSTSIL